MPRSTRALSRAASLALAAGFCAPAHARAVINSAWLTGNSGLWSGPTNWSPSGSPNNGANTFNVTIAVAPVILNYTVTDNTAATITSLFINQINATLLHSAGAFVVTGNVNLTAGTFRHTGGTMDINGGMSTGMSGVLRGNGAWDISGGDLVNDGAITADAGGALTFTSGGGAGVGIWDLDGVGENGSVNATTGDITFTGTVNDAFSGRLNVGPGHTLNMTGGWSIGAAVINLQGLAADTATLEASIGSISSGAAVYNIDMRAAITASATLNLNAGGTVHIADADDQLAIAGSLINLNGTTFDGLGTLIFGSNSSTLANTTLNVATVDWDGTGGPLTHAISAGVTLTINANAIDSVASGGQFDGTINDNGALAINLAGAAAWTLGAASSLNMGAGADLSGSPINLNGVIGVASGAATIHAVTHFDATPGITLNNAADELSFLDGGSFSGGTVSGAGLLLLDGDWLFAGPTTINSLLDFDGLGVGADTYTIRPGSSLTVTSNQSGDTFSDDIVLTGGALSVSNAAGWTIDEFGSISLQNSGANLATLSVGGPFRIDGTLIALPGIGAGSNTTTLSEVATFGLNSMINVASGATLRLAPGGVFEGGTASGLGTLATDGNWTISGAATWGTADLDWDSSALGNFFTINAGASLTINSNITDPMDDNVTLNDSLLAVNAPGGWTLGSGAAILHLNNTATAGVPIVNGTTLTMLGRLDVDGIGIINAPVVFGPPPDIVLDTADDDLRLGGGSTWNGGAINQPGILRLDGDTHITADTTFTSRLDWDGTAANSDLFTVASGVACAITSDQSADPYDDRILIDGGTLNVSNPAGWTLSSLGELRLQTNGVTPATVSGGHIDIAGAVLSQNGGDNTINAGVKFFPSAAVSTPAASDTLVLNGATTEFAGGSYTGLGTLLLETASVLVSADTTINVATLDWDGDSSFNITTINSGVQFNILSNRIDFGSDGFGGVINLDSGTLRVVTAAPWEMGDGGAGALNMNGLNPIVGLGATMKVSAALNVNSANAIILAPVSFLSSAIVDANLAADRLVLEGATSYSGGAYTGPGTIVQNGAASVLANTTIGVARYDWDGSAETTTTTVNAGAVLTLNGGMIDAADNVYTGTTNDSGTVVVDTTVLSWTLGPGGQFNLLTAASRLEGDKVTNNGALTGQGAVTSSFLVNNGSISATGGGTLILSTTAVPDLDGDTALETGVLNVIDGSMHVTGNFVVLFPFNGELNIGAGRTFQMDTFGLMNSPAVATPGFITMTAGRYLAPQFQQASSLTVNAGDSTLQSVTTFANLGTTTIAAGGNLRISGAARVDPGHSMTGAGSLVVDNGSTLSGAGTIGVSLSNNGHVTPGNSVGTLTTTGAFTQSPVGALDIEISGNQPANADMLAITGAASLAGSLNLTLTGGFAPDWGDNWTIMSYASRTGDFNLFTLPALAANLFWWREVNPTIYRVGVRLAADTDHDGDVDFSDLNRVLSTFGMSMAGTPGMMGLIGDANESGTVDFTDLNLVLSFFGQHAPANFAVPAPGAATLALLGLAFTGARRRRERQAA